VQVKLGPDGALYIADFYNAIIGHYEVPLTHPKRDHTHGRIWRIVYTGEKQTVAVAKGPALGMVGVPPAVPGVPRGASELPRTPISQPSPVSETSISSSTPPQRSDVPGGTPATAGGTPTLPNLTQLDAAGLLAKLGDSNLEVRRLATNELADRIGAEAIPMLSQKVFTEREMPGSITSLEPFTPLEERKTAHARWTLDRLAQSDDHLLSAAPIPADGVEQSTSIVLCSRSPNLRGHGTLRDRSDSSGFRSLASREPSLYQFDRMLLRRDALVARIAAACMDSDRDPRNLILPWSA